MDPIDGQEFSSENQEPTAAQDTQVQDHSNDSQNDSNPFWGEVEKKVGPNVWQLIKPDLDKADLEARQRVESVNKSYAPWKSFVDQGITPDHVSQSMGVVRQLNDPQGQLQVFESLQKFLRENGRLPDKQELQEQVEEDGDEGEDPRYSALAQQNHAIMEFLSQRQQQEVQQVADREADSWLDGEHTRLKSKGYDEADIKEIVRIAASSIGANGQVPDNFDAAAAHFDALRDRLLTTPRPGQLAPRLPSGPGGGTPNAGAVDPSNLTKDQRRELVAAMIARGKQQ